ncbi:hypothetical protein HDU98_006255 [Podochytrium sp. JEL0797]|nr:hypothetical protein HDU98_006255 [Podochytrium sp. JEL0797]
MPPVACNFCPKKQPTPAEHMMHLSNSHGFVESGVGSLIPGPTTGKSMAEMQAAQLTELQDASAAAREPTPASVTATPPPPFIPAPFTGILSWPEIVDLVSVRNLSGFSRTPAITEIYVAYMRDHVPLFASVSDCVKIDTLGFPALPVVEGGDGKIRAAENPTKSEWKLCVNKFPYAVQDGIEHLVFWTFGESEMESTRVEAVLEGQLAGREFVWFVNEPSRKTVPGIHHAHVFVNKLE